MVARKRVLFTGDLVFAGGQPFLAEGSIGGYQSSLEFLRSFGASVLVPGHGPPLRGDDINRVLDDLAAYTTYLSELASSGHTAGKTPMEVVREAGESRFSSWQEPERLVGNLHRAYHELDGKPLSECLELPRVWLDMTELHGGPMACHA